MEFSTFPVDINLQGALLAHHVKGVDYSFKKGHKISLQDIKTLQGHGIETVMAARLTAEDLHEDIAAEKIARACHGDNIRVTDAFTGRVNLISTQSGICFFNKKSLSELNRLDEAITLATLPEYEAVQPGQMVATLKIIPFSIPVSLLEKAVAILKETAMEIKPFIRMRCGLIQTRHPATRLNLLDKTAITLGERLSFAQNGLDWEKRVAHRIDVLSTGLTEAVDIKKMQLLLIMGASAITDRKDVIPKAIIKAGGQVERFGMPVDPGNLLLLGKIGNCQIIGMPGCARSPKRNGFDWILQRLLAGVDVTREDISDMAIGGLLKEIPSRPLPRASHRKSQQGDAGKQREIAALVLAAGQSRRMGAENKLTRKIDGIAMIRRCVQTILDAGFSNVLVITGHEQRQIRKTLHGMPVTFRHNARYQLGLSESLKTGIAGLSGRCDAALVCLGDMPLLSTADITKLLHAFNPDENRAICIPTYRGKRGNPVLIDQQFFPEIQNLHGDVGARSVISDYPDMLCQVEMENDAVLKDFDTPAAFE